MTLFLLLSAVISAAPITSRAATAADEDFEILGPELHDLAWTPGVAPTAVEAELEEILAPRKGYFSIPYVSTAVDHLYERRDDLYRTTGLRMGLAYTMLFQSLTGGPWHQFGGAGDLDVMTSWTLVGRETENTGRLLFDIEERFKIGDRTPNSLGSQVATLVPTANTFNERGFVVRDFFWEQRLWEGQFRFLFGRADLGDFFGAHWMQSAVNSFVNRMFAANAPVAGPGHGPATGVAYRPKNLDFFASAGVANAYNDTTTTGFSSLFDHWTLFSVGEVGWIPTFQGLGEGRYTISAWNVDTREETGLPSDWGLTVVADQQICETVEVFARYGYSDKSTFNIHHYAQGGVGVRGLLFNQINDMTGAAFSYAWPRASASRDEKVFEGFYRAQLTRFVQLSVGAQAIFDPANGPSHDVVGAFWGRFRFLF
jgi:porin